MAAHALACLYYTTQVAVQHPQRQSPTLSSASLAPVKGPPASAWDACRVHVQACEVRGTTVNRGPVSTRYGTATARLRSADGRCELVCRAD